MLSVRTSETMTDLTFTFLLKQSPTNLAQQNTDGNDSKGADRKEVKPGSKPRGTLLEHTPAFKKRIVVEARGQKSPTNSKCSLQFSPCGKKTKQKKKKQSKTH